MIEKKIRKKSFHAALQSALISGFISMIISMLVMSKNQFPESSTLHNYLLSGFAGLTIGTLIPTCMFFIQIFILDGQKLKKFPYWIFLLFGIFVTMFISLAIYFLVGIIIFPSHVMDPVILIMAIGLSISLSIILTFSNAIRQFVGPGIISSIISGRYHRAFETDSVFIFIDLISSTAMAEKLGSVKFFNLINTFHMLVESCCYYYEGFVYKYMGDGAILVWSNAEREKPLKCLLEIRQELKNREKILFEEYGEVVGFTAGVHCGRVITGEIGSKRKEIGYWGDAVNTASRIQSSCKDYNTDVLLSADFVLGLNENWHKRIKNIGSAMLRGKEKPVEIFTI